MMEHVQMLAWLPFTIFAQEPQEAGQSIHPRMYRLLQAIRTGSPNVEEVVQDIDALDLGDAISFMILKTYNQEPIEQEDQDWVYESVLALEPIQLKVYGLLLLMMTRSFNNQESVDAIMLKRTLDYMEQIPESERTIFQVWICRILHHYGYHPILGLRIAKDIENYASQYEEATLQTISYLYQGIFYREMRRRYLSLDYLTKAMNSAGFVLVNSQYHFEIYLQMMYASLEVQQLGKAEEVLEKLKRELETNQLPDSRMENLHGLLLAEYYLHTRTLSEGRDLLAEVEYRLHEIRSPKIAQLQKLILERLLGDYAFISDKAMQALHHYRYFLKLAGNNLWECKVARERLAMTYEALSDYEKSMQQYWEASKITDLIQEQMMSVESELHIEHITLELESLGIFPPKHVAQSIPYNAEEQRIIAQSQLSMKEYILLRCEFIPKSGWSSVPFHQVRFDANELFEQVIPKWASMYFEVKEQTYLIALRKDKGQNIETYTSHFFAKWHASGFAETTLLQYKVLVEHKE
ncbi:MAG: hypothetical protein ACRDBX_08415 [Erysipelotrichaceae bacterium]